MFVQILVNGILQGILIGSMGVAFGLVYRTTKVFHIALGGVAVLAPYIVMTGSAAGLPTAVSFAAASGVAAVLGVVLEIFNHRALERNRATPEIHLIASLGSYLVLVQVIALAWGNETQLLREGSDETWRIFSVTLARAQVVGPMIALAAVSALMAWLWKAERGLELRALADNPTLVALLGGNVAVLRAWVFGLSGALAAVASIAQAWDVGFDPQGGLKVVLLGMAATIIGGPASFAAPLAGGVLLGVLRAAVVWFSSSRWEESATFVLVALFLLWRPQGLFARRLRLEELT